MESFEQLAEQYQPMIHHIMRSLNIYKNKDEFLQLGLITLWEASQNFHSEKGKFTNYAYTCIKGKFLSAMTKSNQQEERSVYPKEEFWEFLEDSSLEQPFAEELLLPYCEGLTPNQTMWLQYTCINGLTITEIAKKEHVSVSAVKAWRKGARERLKGKLDKIG